MQQSCHSATWINTINTISKICIGKNTAFSSFYSMLKKVIAGFVLFFLSVSTGSAQQKDTVHFALSFSDAATHTVHVTMHCKTDGSDSIIFKMPQWTPGYYQIMNYANNVIHFHAAGDKDSLAWRKANINTWVVQTKNKNKFHHSQAAHPNTQG